MRNKLDELLSELNKQLTTMGELCTVAINKVTQALKEGDVEQARKVQEADETIDQIEKDIETLCLKMLLEQQPVARDLRQVSSALKMITDMERIGDQTADIAEIIISENIKESIDMDMQEILLMADAASEMVKNSVVAYVNKDLALTQEVIHADDEVDTLFVESRRRLAKFLSEDKGEHGERAMDLMMVAKYLERIADHATNIAEWVEYSITGVHKEGN
ncbi:MAG: phosphate signaling complex protein PhoU [Suipraeoptans sp.]